MSIMREKIEKEFLKHGNNFHYQVVDFLREKEWLTTVSPYYSDFATNITREVDIHAQKNKHISTFHREDSKDVKIEIFAECKYINKKTGLWFDTSKDENKLFKFSARKLKYKGDYAKTLFRDGIDHPHHLKNEPVVKLFAVESGRKRENEDLYKAVNQCLSSLVFYKNTKLNQVDRDKLVGFKYQLPIIIINDFSSLFKVRNDEIDKISNEEIYIPLEVNYAYLDKDQRSKNEYFLIDLVNCTKMDNYLDILESDAEKIGEHIFDK